MNTGLIARRATLPTIVLAGVLVGAAASMASAARFQGLGDLPGNIFHSVALGVSNDGKVVVGGGWSELGAEAYRWTAETGIVGLGIFGGNSGSRAWATSGDGSIVIGDSDSDDGKQAFVWTAAEGLQPLRHPSQPDIRNFRAVDISRDGSVIVGGATVEGGGMRWTEQDGAVGLGPFGDAQIVDAISHDGRVIVGRSESGVEEIGEAYRWEESTGVVGLGDLAGGRFDSSANGVSSDGSFVVGTSYNELGPEAFRWTEATGMVPLGELPGGSHMSSAFGVSGDGTIVVGVSTSDQGQDGFVWTTTDGMRRAQDILVDDFGVDLTDWRIISVRAITEDGTTIIGQAINPDGFREAWIATIPEPSTFTLSLVALLCLTPIRGSRRYSRVVERARFTGRPGCSSAARLGRGDTVSLPR